MAANLIVLPDADQDTTDAADWYEWQRVGRGRKFAARVQDCIRAILRTPRAFAPLRGPYRKAVVRQFPYVVAYHYDDATDTVTVVAVFHTSRDPDDLLRRLP
ncbi:MAG TPA: type II toxin-antitoxin system RelE/ParE family toxin [Gemmataceae bacterium]|jgi:plasmid stabilization system protein ParE|nr:type II toxin-antitoxin system RelE/ParE family toxin [Gemmataceae bacterium]